MTGSRQHVARAILRACYDEHVDMKPRGLGSGLFLQHQLTTLHAALNQLEEDFEDFDPDTPDEYEEASQLNLAIDTLHDEIENIEDALDAHYPEPIQDEEYQELEENIKTYIEEGPPDANVRFAAYELERQAEQLLNAASLTDNTEHRQAFYHAASNLHDRADELRQQTHNQEDNE